MADVLSGSQPPGLGLEMDMTSNTFGSPDVRALETDAVNQTSESTITPPVEMLLEAALRSGINTILDETADDEDELVCVREICQETLARMDRVTAENSLAHRQEYNPTPIEAVEDGADAVNDKAAAAISPPKSPQERLMALVPNAMEKSKSKLTRRPSLSYDSNPSPEMPRWKIIDGNEEPITDLTVIFRGDPVPDGFLKLERSQSGQRADLNKGGRGTFVYLCHSKDQSSGKSPISEIIAIFPERGEFVPSDYEVVRRRGVPANINTGTQGEKIYLCFKRSATSAIVDLVVLFPRKNESLPYGYMKVDKSPLGHVADLNSTSGGTEVFLGYKKKAASLSDLHKLWLFASVTPTEVLGRGKQRSARSPPPPTTPGKLKQLRSAFSLKATEVREQELLAPSSPLPTVPTDPPLPRAKLIGWKETMEYYMYPILLACYTRQGSAAEAAVAGLSHCLDEGVFDSHGSELCRLEVVIDAVTSICQQGIKSRFEPALQFFQKVIRKCTKGFDPPVLHAILKALTFIGDFDSSLAKSFEDELVSKIMCAYEATLISAKPTVEETIGLKLEQSSDALTRELVVDLIDDISTGAEIATITDNMLGVFKSHLSIQSTKFCNDISDAMINYASSVAEKNALQLVVTFSKAVNRKFVGLDVFRANLTLASTLWNHYRRYLKVELALMFEHVLLRILKAPAPCAKNHQMEIMHEMTMWLQLPHNVVEIFLNFDLDRIQQWKIFEHLCSTLGSIGEGSQGGHIGNADDGDDSALELQNLAISTILAMARSIMDASGHAHLISRDQRTRMLSMDNGGWEQDESGEEASPMKDASVSTANGDVVSDQASQPNSPTEVKTHPGLKRQSSRKYGGNISIRMRNELQKHNQQLLKRAMEISSSKSLKKALEYLVAMNFIKDSPRSITSFLRIYHDFFDETEIGDYLGEGDEDVKVQIRLTYVRAISFKGMTLVESLRHFLTNGGFRLPGEAQKIERMVEAFAQCYWDDSPSAFSSADTAMIIAYSIIMLNTDLHNPQVKKNKMSKEQFVKNNRGIDNGKDLPKRFLEEIYDDIAHNPMHIKGSRVIPKASREASVTAADLENEKFRGGIAKAVAQSEELMKDLSHAYNTFQFVGVDTPISPDLIKILFERVWFSLLTLSTSILCDNQSDSSTRMQCLELLRYCISTCLFLNMPVERQAFCGLLRKLQDSLDGRHQEDGDEDPVDNSNAIPDDKKYEWARAIEEAAASDDPWKAMGDIHLLVNDMKETIQVRQTSEKLHSVIQRIHRAHFYLKNSTTFIHEGDLTKKCRSRNQLYRFFLFNDQLLYADKSMTGRWSPHNSLRLKLTRVSNIPDGVMSKHAFQIQNPIKSFVVFADSASSKAEWMRLIDDAIAEASKKINRTARRISTHGLGDTRPSSLVSAASTASSAMKVFMRFSSPMTSPTTERDGSLDSESPVKPGAPNTPSTTVDPPEDGLHNEGELISSSPRIDESCQPTLEVDSNEERQHASDTIAVEVDAALE
ncbi:Brefeldin A-inhibited guanine nucleotide-exchange protein [Phytophthora cinnamomi]|uniref:Brefeldin A-inhibited guanine nucleotide-exchange protein n=1 Tax=Phytophthora cinnamomi TaxID=4785 RepID=UPI003559D996|nr:Brefeldin A-inhibited guanine nucleotide-exchange protein [Phytophthora cinnamomi]